MSKYSFLLQSQEPEYFYLLPSLRLAKHGGWWVAESIEQEEASKAQSQATIKAVQLAKKISKSRGISLEKAFDMLQGGTEIAEIDLLEEFTEETLSMLSSTGSVEMVNAKMVTTFIRCRGEAEIDGRWKRVDDWSIEDTKSMGRKTIANALQFISDEQSAETEDVNAVKKEKEEKSKSLSKT